MPQDDRQPLTPEQVAAQQAKLPPWLKLTPAQREEDKALQTALATVGALGHPTREEKILMRAAALQHHARTQLAVAEFHTSDDEIEQAKRTLAEGLAMAGDYREAANLHPDQEPALRFAQIADAIEKDDAERCDCVPAEHEITEADGTKTKVTIHPRHIRMAVFSKKHGKIMPLIKCQCGDENVRALGPETAARAALVAKARQEAR